jgi:riboflavin biosynthesis pyrimidine reductase
MVLASSVDGCLTSGDSLPLDKNKTWKRQEGVRGYLQQSYSLSSEPGVFNLIPGITLVQTGVNYRTAKPAREDLRLIVIDHQRDLTPQGVLYLSQCVKNLIVVCGRVHPVTKIKSRPRNLSVITQPRFDRANLLHRLVKRNVTKVTIQSSGRLNAKWINEGLVDFLTIIIYPILVGTSGTPILTNPKLSVVRPLRLIDSKPFNFNYIALNYEVLND